MSKRTRGPARSRRTGTKPGGQRPPTSRGVQTSQLEAAEIIAEDVYEHKPAEAAAELESVAKTVPARPGVRTKPGSLLAAKAATEYIYVAQDMRRILIVAAMLFGTLILLWLLIVQLRIIPLPYY